MVDVNVVRTGELFLYDARRDQYDTSIIQDLSGVPSIVGNKLLLSEADVCTYAAGALCQLEMLISIPEPVAAQDKTFGFRSPIDNDRAAVFKVVDDVFYAKVYDKDGTELYSQIINWDGDWTATETKYRISFTERAAEFYINDVRVAGYFGQNVGKFPTTIRCSNGNADNFLIGSLSLFN